MSYGWAPYVPVAKRRAKAKKKMEQLRKKGKNIQPIEIEGRKIAKTFWGEAWCKHLEQFSDYDNRLPRGRTYVRNGSVCHLEIKKGMIKAIVSGSEMYNINIKISLLSGTQWQSIKKKTVGNVGSILELLQGKISDNVMNAVTDPNTGLFPRLQEIKLECSCYDWAEMCKHIAAVLYGVSARLDHSPELLFLLRGVDHMELIGSDLTIPTSSRRKPKVTADLSELFGIDLDETPEPLKKKKQKKSKASAKAEISTTTMPFEPDQINISRGLRASHLKKLRKQFDMTEIEFAKLIGKQVAMIRRWEITKGVLNLRKANLTLLESVFKMNKSQAWKIIKVNHNNLL